MANILIVEDDDNISRLIQTTVTMVDHKADVCANGADAAEKILSGSYDLVLLDVMLPDMDGFEIMEKIHNKDVAVIFLTAMQDVSDRVRGLRLGAEDYIVKPFETVELLARIDVVLRRVNKSSSVLRYAGLVMDLDARTVTADGRPIRLTPKEFDLTAFLLRNRDMVISRERLLAAVWGFDFEGESRTVDVHIQRIRKKLGLLGRLNAVPKMGYILVNED